MALLSRDEILQVADLQSEELEIPEWGGTVRVRALSCADYEKLTGNTDEEKHYLASLVALSCIDAAGSPLFTIADVAALNQKNPHVLKRILQVCNRLNLGDAEAIEDTKKNLGNQRDNSHLN